MAAGTMRRSSPVSIAVFGGSLRPAHIDDPTDAIGRRRWHFEIGWLLLSRRRLLSGRTSLQSRLRSCSPFGLVAREARTRAPRQATAAALAPPARRRQP